MVLTVHPDGLHRTAKMFADSGEAASFDEAVATLTGYVLQLHIGRGVATNKTVQAAAVTAVNAGSRAFLGGVRVRLEDDPMLSSGWDAGARLSTAIQRHGGVLVQKLTAGTPTICIGDPTGDVPGLPVLRATFDGWAAGVVEGPATALLERDYFVPAGVAAAGIAVAEAFQCRRGDLRAGRRDQGLSLWTPDANWLDVSAVGPHDVDIAPSRWWLIGLGHLGQAYLWTIGLLPYRTPTNVSFVLQDDDFITKSNESTGLLTSPCATGRKARAMARALEACGFATALVERRFEPRQGPTGDEPRLALVGVDNPDTRAGLSEAGFDAIVDAGLGGGPIHYLDMQTHAFPSGRRSEEVPGWRTTRTQDNGLLDLPAYSNLTKESADKCGTVEVAGRSVAAVFVGATASALVVAEAMRLLLDGPRYQVVDASLRDLSRVAVAQAVKAPAVFPAFARLG